ncbi:MAG: helix-turn-helix transcriptional regulator [Bacteroidales bacterium]|nr:helix-turn-helix transcriptional regulator [Bacteroidales bacterium]MDD3989504.1 helix-turn-helix transcriptional regulator [Bacteroidales bacterium]
MESDTYDADVMERVIPTENIQIMFHYKNPFVVCHSGDSVVKQPRSIISGLSDNYSDVSTAGETGVVFVSFHPTGACHFFNFPLSEIENLSVDLTDIFYHEIRQIEELLYLKETVREKITVIENFLIGRYSPIPLHESMLIQKGIQIVKKCKGQTNAKYLSDCLYSSPKTLERKFAKYLGKTTKQIIKLIRFQEVLHDFSNVKELSLTEHAYNNGYFDQSHFIHDFKSYTGYTPKEFSAKYPDFNINSESCSD